MAAPPLELGDVQDTVALVAVMFDAVGAAGALGGVVSVVSVDVTDAGELPALLLAVTRKTYLVLFARPVSVVVVVGAVTVTVCHAADVEGRYSRR
jgi:hypothetical protein